MRRMMVCVATLACLWATTSVHADWPSFWHRFHVDAMRMNCWPEPFVHADREAVRTPLLAMIASGWQLQNTLSDHLFHPEDQTLTQAGRLKVHWIMTQAPTHRRAIFVLRGADDRATRIRLTSVKQLIDATAVNDQRPSVTLTTTIPTGGSGAYFNEVDRQLKASVPPPRLPVRESTTNGG